MTILHITGAKSWGGNEQQLIDTCIEFKNTNVINYIYCYRNTPVEIEAKKNKISVINSVNDKTFSLKKGKQLKQVINSNQIEIVHLHTSDSVTTYVISDIFYNLKAPAIFSKKGLNSSTKKGPSVFKYNYTKIKKIICVSEAVLKSFQKTLSPKNHHKLSIVYDGINLKRIKPTNIDIRQKYEIDQDMFIVGNIANHSKAKDLITFVKTANYLVNELKIKKIIFLQIGEKSSYSEEFISLISKYNLNKYFKILGFLDNASSYIHCFDAYLMCSEREGGPTVLLEAFLEKTPVVSTKTGIAEEIITPLTNGLLSDIKDYKNLAKNIHFLINNPKLSDKYCTESYKLVLDKFTTKQLAENTLSIYNEVIREL